MADLLDSMQGPDVPAPKPPVKFRRFDDIDQHRQDIYDHALKGVQERFPLKNATHRLEVSDVQYAPNHKEPTKKDEKEAILTGGRLQRPIQGKVRLIDNATNQVLDERHTTIAHVPHLTSRGVFIHNGTSWLVRNQARLRPGVYVRKQQSGAVEAHINAQPGSGRGFRVNLEPESGLFKVQIGQSTTRLYPLLKALGVGDDALKQAWGDELFKANWRGVTGHDNQDLKKVVEKLGRKHEREAPDEHLPQTLQGILGRTKVDPDTTELTLGKRHETLSPDVLTRVTQKILRVARDEEPGDNRDAQAFQSLHSAEDHFRERLKRDQTGAAQKLLWKATRDGNLGSLQSGLLTPNIHAIFRGSGLAHASEEVNPYETHDLRQGITRMGEGGISSAQSVSKEARGVQPSHFGLIDPSRSPESSAIGLDMRVTDAALKGSDNQLYTTLRNTRTGQSMPMSGHQIAGKVVAFPGEMADKTNRKVRAMVGDQIRYVNRGKVDFELPDSTHMFSRVSNMIPMPEGMKSKRLAMGSRMITQSMPLKNPEAPLVQSIDHEGKSFYDEMGRHAGAVHADKPGQVIGVSPDAITVLHPSGEKKEYQLYNNFPLARKTALHNTPSVKIGDQVQPGQLLAKSNFTDEHGRAAPGLNMRVGYLSGHGATYEDAIVISASAANRLTSEHQYKQKLELGPEIHSTKTADYRAIYGDKYTPEQFRKLDDDGVARVGQTINPGDPLIVAIGKRQGRAVGALMKSDKSAHTDATQVWEHPQPGVVTDVSRTRSGIKVAVKSYEPMTVGSKMSSAYGNKGVVSSIVPDDQMPHDEEGKPLEVLLGPTGVITRSNPGLLASTLLGKVAAKTGKPYLMKSFEDKGGLADFALAEARNHGVKETETLTDPRDGRKIPGVFTGHQYLAKLHHTAEGKLSARDTGGYSVDESPARGGKEGSKRIGMLGLTSLLSSGATEFLKDAKMVRGQRNDDYWRSLKTGGTPMAPNESFANKHFLNLLRAAGVNVRNKGQGKTQLSFMTDRDVDAMAQHEIGNSGTFNFNTMKPIENGLFDFGKTGGADGTRWSKINLPVKIPNPLAQDPIVRMLGLTNKKFEAILAGQEKIGDKTGPEAIEHALKGIDVAKAIEQTKQEVKGSTGTGRDIAIKKLGYLTGLQTQGLKPEELMISKLPLLPPKYRPVLRARGVDMVHDANYLYHDVLEASKNWSEHQKEFGNPGDTYLNLYNSAKAVAGVADPVDPKHAEQGIRGMLRFAIGVKDSPKFSRFQRKVLGNTVDTIGRSVITVDPAMDMDSIGIPADAAWRQFRPFVIARLVRSGVPAAEAVKAVKNKSKQAEHALETEMSERPVVYNRAPELHRYNYVGGIAHINHEQSNISISQAVTKGLGADFDGDSGLILLWIKGGGDVTLWVNHEGTSVMPFGNTQILSYSGPIAIQDLPVKPGSKVVVNDHCDEYDVVEGIQVYALDPKTGEHGWFPITKFSVHRNLDMRAVTMGTRGGAETVAVSADHSLIVYQDGVIKPLNPDNSLGLMVPVAKELASDGLHALTVTATGQFGKGIGGAGTLWADRGHVVDLDRATGLFIGMLVGDGWIDSNGQTKFASAVPEIRDVFVQASGGLPYGKASIQSWTAPSLGGVETERGRVGLCNSWFNRWLKPHIGTGAINKKLPSFSMAAPEEHLLGLLDGLLTTDGTVNLVQAKTKTKAQFQVSLTTISADLVSGFQFILRRLGVRSSVTLTSSRVSGTKAYSVSVSTVDFKKMAIRTGFALSHPDKQANMVRGLGTVNENSAVAVSMDLVPYPRHLHQLLCNVARQLLPGNPDRNAATCSAAAKNGFWSRMLAKRHTDAVHETIDFAELGINRGIPRLSVDSLALKPAWDDYVALIEDTAITWKLITGVDTVARQTGFDITVPGPLTFATASGVIVQDTINVHVPVSREASNEVKEKLLPSRNLLHPNSFDVHLGPTQEFLGGLYTASQKDHKKPTKIFATADDAMAAYTRGEIGVSDPVQILSDK